MINHSRTYIEETYPQHVGDWDGRMYIGNGWVPFVNRLVDEIDMLLSRYNRDTDKEVTISIVQIKEKFGGLRFYFDFVDYPMSDDVDLQSFVHTEFAKVSDTIYRMVSRFESLSHHLCETCGSYAELRKHRGWLYTACDDHVRKVEVEDGEE